MKTGQGTAIAVGSSFFLDRLYGDQLPATAASLFESRFGVTSQQMKSVLQQAMSRGGDFAELYFQYNITNSITMEEDIIKETGENVSVGVGIRVIKGEQTGYGYTNDLALESMKRAALTAAAIAGGSQNAAIDLTVQKPALQVYDLNRPFSEQPLEDKLTLVRAVYGAAQKYDAKIIKVRVFLADSIDYVTVANSEGLLISDIRPQTRLRAVAIAEQNGQRNNGFHSAGGRVGADYFAKVVTPKEIGEKAAEEALTLLAATDAQAGEQPVILGVGQSGVMIHEAVGHPLEADGNRKGTSIMANRLGKKVATDLVTIYEDPTLPHLRGSLNIDDEGVGAQKTMLIEKGVLIGYIQDRLSAKIMKMKTTGNGRRETYQNIPIPRMTNTVLAQGSSDPNEIIASVKQGFYAKSYQGGQVEVSGKFVFSVNLGYQIENGKLARPVKNATLIGTNVQILENISMVGNDMGYFLGTCGKEGQSASVTAGTPTMKIERMTVGGRK